MDEDSQLCLATGASNQIRPYWFYILSSFGPFLMKLILLLSFWENVIFLNIHVNPILRWWFYL